ncbi:MAG: para-aminobenzoate synthetase component [Acidobacteriota bacterium]|jgi:para-aminobenzoate synthetase component 1|nr:para-aminobenzoate synthetase component [Acidobacteriota bacterium]
MKAQTPTVQTIPLTVDQVLRALLALDPERRLSLLDSCGAPDASARFLIAGFDPFEVIEDRGNAPAHVDPLDLLDARLFQLRSERPEKSLPAGGACIATFSYELVHRLERLRLSPRSSGSEEPEVVLAFYDTLVVHDYNTSETHVVSVAGPRKIAETIDILSRSLDLLEPEEHPSLPFVEAITSNLSRHQYLKAVDEIKQHIAAGDIYQANLTQQFRCKLSPGSRPEDVFLRLRRDHPAAFGAFIRRREDVVISASPERFVRVNARDGERYAEAWPIKGTRPRGATPDEDARLRAELLASEKDRAENIMIVDLMRNDLGRVSRYGSVEVMEICKLQEHPTLFHLVSKVGGTLRQDVTAAALIRAVFPCGSVTGAPKIRTMEIIHQLEPAPRGLSMGAIGYFSFDGALDLSVAIRTLVIRDSVATFNVGGGIVSDSVPALEYEESLLKARALLHALGADLQSLSPL